MSEVIMKRPELYYFYKCKNIFCRMISKDQTFENLSDRIGNKYMLGVKDAHSLISNAIENRHPFLAGRFGGFELSTVIQCIEGRFSTGSELCEHLINNAGVFGANKEVAIRFTHLYLKSAEECDLLGRHWNGMEDYIIRAYCLNTEITNMFFIEPWYPGYDDPWTKALKNKRVLIIHPFANTIREQYQHRDKIFKDSNILPLFDLLTLKAVQTIAGEKDSRFNDWFAALEWMYNEAMKLDFDVAIIGCGAYGFPLAAKLKEAGKVAIHLGGATQLLFGIKGKRWEEHPAFAYVKNMFNDAWVYPSPMDSVSGAKNIENGCYWGPSSN